MHNSLLYLLLKNCDSLNTNISQGSVATCLLRGGVFKYDFVTNFLLSLTVKEFWQTVNIWWSYGQEFGGSGLRREYGSRRPCSCTRPLMELRRYTWVNWFVSPICLVDVLSALPGPIVCWYRPWNYLPSAAGPSRSPDPSGTACRTTWYLPRLCQPSVSV